MNLFIKEDFISHAGLPLTWKVECDALDENDYEAFEKALKPYCSNNDTDPLLICDDVYTTGTSMREVYEDGALGIVVFARNEIQDDWVKAIWQLSI
jgi:hypothetical protein